MKKLTTLPLSFAIIMLAVSAFTSCQRYPWLSYYIEVQDASGNNLLTEDSVAGKINVYDIIFERHYPDTVITFQILTPEQIAINDSIKAAEQNAYEALPDSAEPYPADDTTNVDTDSTDIDSALMEEKRYYQNEALYNGPHYDRPHIFINADARIGVELEECPTLVIRWPNGTKDCLKVANPQGTLRDPEYYINNKKVKDDKGFIKIIK